MKNLDKQVKQVLRLSSLMGNEINNQSHIDLYVDLLNEGFNGIGKFRLSLRSGDKIGIRHGLADIWIVAVQLAHLSGYSIAISERSFKKGSINHGHDISAEHLFDYLSQILHYNADSPYHAVSSEVVLLITELSRFATDHDIDQAADLDEVIRSDLSKFCKTREEAESSVDAWDSRGMFAEIRETGDDEYPYSLHSKNNWSITEGRIMQPINFKGADLK